MVSSAVLIFSPRMKRDDLIAFPITSTTTFQGKSIVHTHASRVLSTSEIASLMLILTLFGFSSFGFKFDLYMKMEPWYVFEPHPKLN